MPMTSMETEYAYITGGASGIGAATARMLASKGINVFIADRDSAGAESVAKEIGGKFGVLDVTSWDDQVRVFAEAVAWAGRIQYVFAIAGVVGAQWIPPSPTDQEFIKPDLNSVEANLYGVLYTCSLAVQQGRRQTPGKHGFKMKINVVGSALGIYCCPTLPMYTTAKHGVTGLVRSLGKYLPSENMTLNGLMPNLVRTNIAGNGLNDDLDALGLLTPMTGVMEAFESLLGENTESGECFEIGPNYAKGQGLIKPVFPEPVDQDSRKALSILEERCLPLMKPR